MENLGFDWTSVRRLGILGGTFDPIHHGHLAVARQVRRAYGLDRVVFIPSGYPPHKPNGSVSTGQHRYMMALLATCDEPAFSVSQVAMMRTEISYTVHTLRLLQSWTGLKCRLYFIAGGDMALDLPNWREPDAILDQCQFVAVQRPGYALDNLRATLGEKRMAKVDTLTLETPDISATEVRRRVLCGEDISDYVPETVRLYILAAGLYLPACLGMHACGG